MPRERKERPKAKLKLLGDASPEARFTQTSSALRQLSLYKRLSQKGPKRIM